MCTDCNQHSTHSRRRFLASATAGLLTGLVGTSALAAGGSTTSVTAEEALEKLVSGNARYVESQEVCAVDVTLQRELVAKAQMPWATIVSCADSRVPPELLFGGLGAGELFVTRNAGNMVDTATMGTIEYGSGVLGVPLIVVLGHERCGAVAAACDVVTKKAKFPGSIGPMVQAIVPAAKATAGKGDDHVEDTVRESALRTARKIATQSPIISALVKKGKVKVVAARYDLDDGAVTFLS